MIISFINNHIANLEGRHEDRVSRRGERVNRKTPQSFMADAPTKIEGSVSIFPRRNQRVPTSHGQGIDFG